MGLIYSLLIFTFFTTTLPGLSKIVETVQVKLFSTHKQIINLYLLPSSRIISPTELNITKDAFKINCLNNKLLIINNKTNKIIFKSQKLILSQAKISLNQANHRNYTGLIYIQADKNCYLHITNKVSKQKYTTIVVSSETPHKWPAEALKAQAILTQTRLLAKNTILLDSTQDEAYLGEEYIRPEVEEAVKQVWNKVLTYKNKPIEVYYHSTCAGQTSSSKLFNTHNKKLLPYLNGVNCNFCLHSPFWQTKEISIPNQIFQTKMKLNNLQLIQSDKAGRPLLFATNTSSSIEAYKLWLLIGQQLGWDKVPGTNFKITQNHNSIIIQSKGAGHGVGLCQWGAAEQAKQGRNYTEILKYYFPGTEIRSQ
jgi:stage II sporulation protein D